MGRVIETHKQGSGANDPTIVDAIDSVPGPGGLCSLYKLFVLLAGNSQEVGTIKFDKPPGPPTPGFPEAPRQGPNGVTDASLLAVLVDRLEKQAEGGVKSKAYFHLQEALSFLLHGKGRVAKSLEAAKERLDQIEEAGKLQARAEKVVKKAPKTKATKTTKARAGGKK